VNFQFQNTILIIDSMWLFRLLKVNDRLCGIFAAVRNVRCPFAGPGQSKRTSLRAQAAGRGSPGGWSCPGRERGEWGALRCRDAGSVAARGPHASPAAGPPAQDSRISGFRPPPPRKTGNLPARRLRISGFQDFAPPCARKTGNLPARRGTQPARIPVSHPPLGPAPSTPAEADDRVQTWTGFRAHGKHLNFGFPA
jgi:hypothetical protein